MSPPAGITLTATSISCNAVQLTWTDGTNTAAYYAVFRTNVVLSETQWIGDVWLNENINTDSQDNNGWDAANQDWVFNDDEVDGSTEYSWTVEAIGSEQSVLYEGSSANLTTISCFSEENFNCECTSWPNDAFATLAELRTAMMNRLGFAAVASNPPPGMVAMLNGFLEDAQKQAWKMHTELHTERFFSWTMVPGQRYYGLADDEGVCMALDPYKVTWAGFQDLNQAWYQLVEGIDPVLYTRATITLGWPTRYEIRSCIEIFPAPRAAYTLWIKGHFGLQPFSSDSDTTTIDSHAVFLLALGNAKSHYAQPDAQNVLTQADGYIKQIVAGKHGTRRYVPRTRVEEPMVPPRFLPLHGAAA